MAERKHPSYLMHVVLGAIFGAVVQWFIPVTIPEDVPILQMLLTYILFSALLAFGYYTFLRASVADVKLKDGSRVTFALFFFAAIGLSLGMGIVKIYQGHPVLNIILFFGVNTIFLAVAYRKLLKVYRAANTNGPGETGLK